MKENFPESLYRGLRYRHYKTGEDYQIIEGNAIMEATGEKMVVYGSELSGDVYIRPLTEFKAEVEHEQKQVPRFTRLPDNMWEESDGR